MYCDRCGAQNRDDARFCSGCGNDLAHQRADMDAGGDLSMQEVGAVIGNRYRIDEEVGRGGMGIVYRAFDQELEMPVAIKVLHPRVADRPEAVTQLREEALAAMRLTHPNIVRLHNFENTAQAKYLLMEHVPGQSLAQMLANGLAAGFTERDVVRIAQQVCDGLSAAHKAGVIHRDIKPSNVLITPEGRVKIVDFGIARAQGLRLYQGPRTTGAGTPTYMAPEQFRGDKVDGRTDVYALGATIYEVLATHPPFVGADLKRQHLEDAAEPIPGVSDWLNEIVLRCLSKDPRDRWQSVEALRAALEGKPSQGTAALSAQPKTDTEPEWRRVARERERREQMLAADKAQEASGKQAAEQMSPTPAGVPKVVKPQRPGALPPAGPVTPLGPGGGGLVRRGGSAYTPTPSVARAGVRQVVAKTAARPQDKTPDGIVWRLPSGLLQFGVGAAVLMAVIAVGSTWAVAKFSLPPSAALFVQLAVGGVLGAFLGLAEVETRNFLIVVSVGLAAGLLIGLLYVQRGVTADTSPTVLLIVEGMRGLILGGALGCAMGAARGAPLAALLAGTFAALGGLIGAAIIWPVRMRGWLGESAYLGPLLGLVLLGFLVTCGAAIGANLVRTEKGMRL